MIYLIIGPDTGQRESRIAELKKNHLPGQDSVSFDYELLYAHKLDPVTLRKALLALPVFSPTRLVLIRECHKLSEDNRRLLLDFLKGRHAHLVLILESEQLTAKDAFVKTLRPYVELLTTATERMANIFDVARDMSMQRQPQALKTLHGLMAGGTHPLQLLGGLVWCWGDMRDGLAQPKFEAGLRALQEADLNIKRSRIKPEYALEILVVKLCGLLGE